MAVCSQTPSQAQSNRNKNVDSTFTPVKLEDQQKYRTDQTSRGTEYGVKQTSTSRWTAVYEQAGTGVKSVDMKTIFRTLSVLTDADYEIIKIGQSTARLDNIAYFVYGTPYLWWAIRIANYDKFDTPFSTVTAGTNLKVIRREPLFAALQQASEK